MNSTLDDYYSSLYPHEIDLFEAFAKRYSDLMGGKLTSSEIKQTAVIVLACLLFVQLVRGFYWFKFLKRYLTKKIKKVYFKFFGVDIKSLRKFKRYESDNTDFSDYDTDEYGYITDDADDVGVAEDSQSQLGSPQSPEAEINISNTVQEGGKNKIDPVCGTKNKISATERPNSKFDVAKTTNPEVPDGQQVSHDEISSDITSLKPTVEMKTKQKKLGNNPTTVKGRSRKKKSTSKRGKK